MMETYSREDFEGIAAAIEKEIGEIIKYKQFFEGAADWYRLDCGLPREDLVRPYRPPPSKRREKPQRIRPGGTPPSKMREKVQRIAKSARRLLNDLGVTTIEEAFDGPGHFELLEILAAVEVPSEHAVVNATRRVGQFATMMDAVEATVELEQRSLKALEEVLAEGKPTVPKGHQGDIAVNNWIAMMMEIYRKINGAEPATSVGQVGQPNGGIASGPFIRFLQAAGKPLGMKYSEDAGEAESARSFNPTKLRTIWPCRGFLPDCVLRGLMRPTRSKSSISVVRPTSSGLIDLVHLLAQQAAREVIASDIEVCRGGPERTTSETSQLPSPLGRGERSIR